MAIAAACILEAKSYLASLGYAVLYMHICIYKLAISDPRITKAGNRC